MTLPVHKDVCARFTLAACFHIYLLREKVSLCTLKSETCMYECDFVASWSNSLHKFDILSPKNGLFSEEGDILCLAIKT